MGRPRTFKARVFAFDEETGKAYLDETGNVYGRLTVVRKVPRPSHLRSTGKFWLCRCECGRPKTLWGAALRSGNTASCGCSIGRSRRQGNKVRKYHGRSYEPEYNVWRSMIARCHNPRHVNFLKFGALGIRVCKKWRKSYEFFREDMGRRPPGMILWRKDAAGNYEPDNCLWITAEVRPRSFDAHRKLVLVDVQGTRRCLADWAKTLGLSRQAIHERLYKGWSHEQACTIPRGD